MVDTLDDGVGLTRFLIFCAQEGAFEVAETRLYQYRLVTGEALAQQLATRLHCDGTVEMLVPRRLWCLGRVGTRTPIFFARDTHRQDAATVFASLHERMKGTPGIVLVPHAFPAPGVLPAQVAIIPLAQVWWWVDETLRVSMDGIDAVITGLGGNKPTVYLQPITVPAGFTWPQVRLEFISDEDVRIWTVGEPVVRSMGELGLANQRDGSPTKRWELLREFAGHEGVYDLSHPSVLYPPEKVPWQGRRPQVTAFSGKLGTALSDLAEHLRQLFPGIAGKPFARYDTVKHQYRAHIRLSWEPGYRQRKAQEYRQT